MLYKAGNEAIKFYDDYSLMMSEANTKAKQNETKGTGLKILTPKQMLQRLPIALAQVKAGNNSENLLTAAASAADAGIHKKILGSGNNTTLIISNKDMDDLIKIVKSLEDSGLLLKGITESVQNEIKEQKGGFLSMLLGTLGASLLGNLLTGKGAFHARKRVNKKGKGIQNKGWGICNKS